MKSQLTAQAASNIGFMASIVATDKMAVLLNQSMALVEALIHDESYSSLPEAVLGNMLDVLHEKLQHLETSFLSLDATEGALQ